MKRSLTHTAEPFDRSAAHVARAGGTRLRLAFLVLFLAALVALYFASCRSVAGGLGDGRLRPCPSSSNCVCSEEFDGEASIPPLAFDGDPRGAFVSLLAFLRAEPRVELVTVETDYVHAVFKTRILRFRDDVEFRLDAAGGVIHVRSASRVGYSDLGANRERVESIRARWDPGPG